MWPDDFHVGRSWTGHPLEDACPCPKEPCGLVSLSGVDPNCPQHAVGAARTFRQSHNAQDCPAKPPGEALEPVPLRVLAEAIRDETWLDMAVLEVGVCERVRAVRLILSRERDDVEVLQAWPDQGLVSYAHHTFDSDLVIKVRPTQVELLDVKKLAELEPPMPTREPNGLEAEAIIAEIVRTVAHVNGVDEEGIRAPTAPGRPTYEALRPRQEAMWLAYEMTSLSPLAICKDFFGYGSQQPLVTIADKLVHSLVFLYKERPGAWVKRVREKAALIDDHFDVRFRRDTRNSWATVL